MDMEHYFILSGCRTGSYEARQAREEREGKKISAYRHTIALALSPSTHPQKLTAEMGLYQTHDKTEAWRFKYGKCWMQ